jgi:hypothetical protein
LKREILNFAKLLVSKYLLLENFTVQGYREKNIASYKFIWGYGGMLAGRCKVVAATNLDFDI